jgi:hypothetical protein
MTNNTLTKFQVILYPSLLILFSCSTQHDSDPILEDAVSTKSYQHAFPTAVSPTLSASTAQSRVKIWDQKISISFYEETFGIVPGSDAAKQIEVSKDFLGGTSDVNHKIQVTLGYHPINRPDSSWVTYKGVAGAASLTPTSSVVREAQRVQICHAIMKLDQHIVNAIKSTLEPDEFKAANLSTRLISYQNIYRLFVAFYSGKRPSPEIVDALFAASRKVLAEEGASEIDSWRFVLLPLCMDAGTQLI